jgi:2-polyprenyl-3-methyl-5-hydroxy-6-metoxy-1,4-benzoquinol methylase
MKKNTVATIKPNPDLSHQNKNEIKAGERFAFGENWRKFLHHINEERIDEAVRGLKEMLELTDLTGKTFLDVGCGSGLFSLAARKLNATVISFDYDPESTACATELKSRFYPNDPTWEIHSGSVLDSNFLNGLPPADIMYSWGVLHHTGDLWQALGNVSSIVKENGQLFISLYNDQGITSDLWKAIKKTYNFLPRPIKLPFAVAIYAPLETRLFIAQLLRGRPLRYFTNIINYGKRRGMSWWHDKIDWIGGYPFEVSSPEQVFDFLKPKGYSLSRLTTVGGGSGCNQFVFRRNTPL